MNNRAATFLKQGSRNPAPLPDAEFTIETAGLVKRFGFKTVLRNIDLKLEKGTFLSLFGPNGAGKTTLMQILGSRMQPTSGTVYVSGMDTRYDREEVHRRIGVVSHDPYLYGTLTAGENLRFYAKMYDAPVHPEAIGALLDRVGLYALRNESVHTFSRGMLQRLSIARAVIHDPPVLLFDEPFNGLDQEGIDDLEKLLKTYQRQGKTIVMASHQLKRAAALCSHAAILAFGRIVFMARSSTINKDNFQKTYLRHAGDAPASDRMSR